MIHQNPQYCWDTPVAQKSFWQKFIDEARKLPDLEYWFYDFKSSDGKVEERCIIDSAVYKKWQAYRIPDSTKYLVNNKGEQVGSTNILQYLRPSHKNITYHVISHSCHHRMFP